MDKSSNIQEQDIKMQNTIIQNVTFFYKNLM